MNIQVIRREGAIELVGPRGRVTLLATAERVNEAYEGGPGQVERVTIEWGTEVSDERGPRLAQVLFAFTHDSNDGEHRVVLEEGYVCAPLVAQIGAQLGAPSEPVAFVRALAFTSHPATLEALADAAELHPSEFVGATLRPTERLALPKRDLYPERALTQRAG